MNNHLSFRFLVLAMLAFSGLLAINKAPAQIFTTLHMFAPPMLAYPQTNLDGAHPECELVLSGNTLYGTAPIGSATGDGTVFGVNTNGTPFTNLYNFTVPALNANETEYINFDGFGVGNGLVGSGNPFYGIASQGGTNGFGTVFAVSTNGFATLHTFTGKDGSGPVTPLILSGETLYGTTASGGSSGNGTIFAINTNGLNFANLYNFSAETSNSLGHLTNSDGATPLGVLVLEGNTLYGTANAGGLDGYGAIFALNLNDGHFTNLYSFTGGNDGANPQAGLILSDATLYGTAVFGGTNGAGSIFAINTNDLSFKNLYSFSSSINDSPNADGANPLGPLTLAGGTLFGTAVYGGTKAGGTVFAIGTNGTGFAIMHEFTGGNDGENPAGGLLLANNTFYGTASGGGTGTGFNGGGTVFSISLSVNPPKLFIALYTTNVVLTWTTNSISFTLESTTNLIPPTTWITNSSSPVIINGNNTVTNSVSNTLRFYRLSE
jgi:uncharacterized repeat protein (TIGR03803 family)